MRANSRPERSLLISDLHLEEQRPELTRAFLQFLEREAEAASDLYILGDLFNVWIGDDDDRPLNGLVSSALREHADAGLRIHLQHGNRDFLLGQAFAAASGAELLDDPVVIRQDGAGRARPCVLMHGDLLCTLDSAYQAFRRTVRDPAWQRDFSGKALQERRAFAEQARAASKSMSSNKPEDIMDVSQDAVERVLREHGVQLLIHGHTHRPAVHEFMLDGAPCKRVVLGDWGAKGWFVEINADGIALRDFDIA